MYLPQIANSIPKANGAISIGLNASARNGWPNGADSGLPMSPSAMWPDHTSELKTMIASAAIGREPPAGGVADDAEDADQDVGLELVLQRPGRAVPVVAADVGVGERGAHLGDVALVEDQEHVLEDVGERRVRRRVPVAGDRRPAP